MIDISKNRVVVVTGASSGIGKAVSTKYSQNGYRVIGLDKAPAHSEYMIIPCKIESEESVRRAFQKIEQHCHCINYLINCAGIFFSGNRTCIDKMDLSDWNHVIQVNLTGTMLVIQHAIPLLEKASEDRGIVNISSDQALHPRRRNGAYAVTKGGIETLTRLCATELLDKKIRVNAVAPAAVRSNFIMELAQSREKMEIMYRKQAEIMPLGLIEADDVAEIVLFLGSPVANKITGQILSIDSGLYLKG